MVTGIQDEADQRVSVPRKPFLDRTQGGLSEPEGAVGTALLPGLGPCRGHTEPCTPPPADGRLGPLNSVPAGAVLT